MERSQDRLDILKKIEEYEKNGWFDRDVEDDPPTKPLDYTKVDYTGKKLSTRIKSEIANRVAKNYFDGQIKKNRLIIKEVRGLDNYLSVMGGAVITCNHFNHFKLLATDLIVEDRIRLAVLVNTLLAELDETVTCHNDKLFPFGVVPMLTFGNAWLGDIDAYLTTVESVYQFCE